MPSKLTRWILLFSIISLASAQQKASQPTNAPSQMVEYKSRQVLKTDVDATITVLAVEEVHKVGQVVHVRVDNIPVWLCGEVHLTTAIPHVALTRKMMQYSVDGLVQNKC